MNIDERNNLIVLIMIISAAIIISAFIYTFSASVLDIATRAQTDVNEVGHHLTGNMSQMLELDRMKVETLNKTIAHMDKFNYQGIHELMNLTSDLTEQTNQKLDKIIHLLDNNSVGVSNNSK